MVLLSEQQANDIDFVNDDADARWLSLCKR
jgi:hypothetical protein